jgi:hypothetical protein
MRFITIAYDPKTCDNGEPMDLYEYLTNELNNSGIQTAAMEFKRTENAKMEAEWAKAALEADMNMAKARLS